MAGITDDDRRRLKLFLLLEKAGQSVLTYTLLCGTPPGKAPTETLLQYLNNLPPHSTANYARETNPSRSLNATDKSQINRDPTCTTFDVTLLYKAIRLTCENLAGLNEKVNNDNVWKVLTQGKELEYYTTKIKDKRNEVVHEGKPLNETDFLNEVTTLFDLFENCLMATKDRYNRDDTEYQAKRADVQAKVTDIKNGIIGASDILRTSAVSMLPNFKLETDHELRRALDSARYLTPLHFLSGIPEDRVEVSDIFCEITLAEERGTASRDDAHKVPYLDVLRLCEGATSGPARPQMLMVEGEAGSGKTTWACFLVQQSLTPQDQRRVQGLEPYELLLRVVCRERRSTTLEGFVQQLLPDSYLRYGRLLLPLLKKCRVLIIIDGIDEMNDVSRPLVDNILSEAAATAFTIVCTSRPHSVQELKTDARNMHFQVSHVRMLGVSGDTHRTELIVKHYKWLCAGARTAANTAAIMKAVQDIVWREVFRLPLNLLFLATVVFFEPHRLSTSFSQNDLYQYIYNYCREKLLDRLGGQARLPRRLLHAAVDRVLHVINEVALKGLLQDRLCLNDQDLQDVHDACTKERLDPDEVLSAFYSMRSEVTAGIVKETYMAPHKSLQEFMAAKVIAEQMKKYSEGDIERVLRGYTAGQDPPLRQLQKTLVYLLSMLTRHGGAMKEIVNLIRVSGVKRMRDWLDLLTTSMAPDAVVQYAAEQLVAGGLDDETIYVMDEQVHVASVMLQHLPRQKVVVTLTREVADVDNLVKVLARHEVTKLYLEHHYRHPHEHTASGTLLQPLKR